MSKKSFASLSLEERSETVSKMIFLMAHLDLCVDLIDDLEGNQVVWRHKLKQTGKPFLNSALSFTKEILTQFSDDERLMDESGNIIGSDEEVQLQAIQIIKQVKELNQEAIKNLTKIIS